MDAWVFAPLRVATPKDDEVGGVPAKLRTWQRHKNVSPIPASQMDGASWI